jgi:hypothetical protein
VAFQERDLVRIGIEGESPLQDGAAATVVADGRKVRQAADAMRDARRIFRNQTRGKSAVAEGCGEENIGSSSAVEKKAGNCRRCSDAPLGRSGIVVFIAGVNVRAMFGEKLRGGEIAGEMERRAAIAAPGVDQRWIGAQEVVGGEAVLPLLADAPGQGGVALEEGFHVCDGRIGVQSVQERIFGGGSHRAILSACRTVST